MSTTTDVWSAMSEYPLSGVSVVLPALKLIEGIPCVCLRAGERAARPTMQKLVVVEAHLILPAPRLTFAGPAHLISGAFTSELVGSESPLSAIVRYNGHQYESTEMIDEPYDDEKALARIIASR